MKYSIRESGANDYILLRYGEPAKRFNPTTAELEFWWRLEELQQENDQLKAQIEQISPEIQDSEDSREHFELWISDAPFEMDTDRYPDDPIRFAFPSNYKDINTQLAWEAWQQARKSKPELE